MFKNIPKILSHKSATESGNFVTAEYILNKGTEDFANLFHRFCPHRMYPMHTPGEIVQNIQCQFHNFQWDSNGVPLNNPKKLHCGKATIGKSGLVFKDFVEPEHQWVEDLAKETNLHYSHSYKGTSKGSWLWFMDVNVDLLHVYQGGIHPFLSKQVSLDDVEMDEGDGWVLQRHPDGWWCCIYPFTFVEYGNPGKLSINVVTPHNVNSEFGFDWITQIYYDPSVGVNDRMIFETLEPVFHEDIGAAEKQKGGYFPLANPINKYENHCIHWGKWYTANKVK